MIRLSKLSPLESNPGDIRVALRVPASITIRDGDAKLFFGFKRDDGLVGIAETFHLVVRQQSGAAPGIGALNASEERLFVTEMDKRDTLRFADAQRQVKAWRAASIDGNGTLSVSLTGCYDSLQSPDVVPVSAYVQTAPTDPFARISRFDNLNEILRQEGLPPLVSCTDLAGIDPLVDD